MRLDSLSSCLSQAIMLYMIFKHERMLRAKMDGEAFVIHLELFYAA
jgi:hypothetical protein